MPLAERLDRLHIVGGREEHRRRGRITGRPVREHGRLARSTVLTLLTALAGLTLLTALAGLTLLTALAGLTLLTALAGLTLLTALAGLTLLTALAGLTLLTALAGLTLLTALAGLTLLTALAGTAGLPDLDDGKACAAQVLRKPFGGGADVAMVCRIRGDRRNGQPLFQPVEELPRVAGDVVTDFHER